jgi:hypothetical protein
MKETAIPMLVMIIYDRCHQFDDRGSSANDDGALRSLDSGSGESAV